MMLASTVSVVIPPDPLVTWEEAQAAIRIDDPDYEQTYVEGLIAACCAWIDGPSGFLGKSMGRQTLEARFDSFTGVEVTLPYGPVLDVVDVRYLDAAGAEQLVPGATYYLLSTGRLRLAPSAAWPSAAHVPEAVRYTYEAGHPDEQLLPAKQAVLLAVAHWYQSREAVNVGNIVSKLPLGFTDLLSIYRSWA